MPTNLESHIHQIIFRAAGQIAELVRANLPAPRKGSGTNGRKSAGGRRRGRPPSAGRMAKVSTRNGNGRAPHPRRSYSDAEVSTLLELIREYPGLHSVEIQSVSGMDKNVVDKVLAKLRTEKHVKTDGQRRAMTYSAY